MLYIWNEINPLGFFKKNSIMLVISCELFSTLYKNKTCTSGEVIFLEASFQHFKINDYAMQIDWLKLSVSKYLKHS